MKLAILIPTRGRPKGLYRLFESINDTISNSNIIYFTVGIDKDDSFYNEYNEVLELIKYRTKNMIITISETIRKPIANKWNELVKINNSDWFMLGSDDLIFQTEKWDIILNDKIKSLSHPYYLIYFDEGIHGEKHSSFPIVSKKWIETLGYFMPEKFTHNYIDTWLFNIAIKANVAIYIPEIITKHLHYTTDSTIKFDQTYADGLADNAWINDEKLFNETESERLELVEKIKEKIILWK